MEITYTGKAEGTCTGLPYDTELAGPNGVSVHFWTGDLAGDALKAALKRAEARVCGVRDVVRIQHSPGAPEGYWAHSDI